MKERREGGRGGRQAGRQAGMKERSEGGEAGREGQGWNKSQLFCVPEPPLSSR